MARFWIIGGILWVALLVYGIVDLIVTGDHRIRRLNRVLWAVIIVLVPIAGPVAWLTLGKGPVVSPPSPPDDLEPPSPTTSWLSDEESDRRIHDIEQQLAALDAEEPEGDAAASAPQTPSPRASSPQTPSPQASSPQASAPRGTDEDGQGDDAQHDDPDDDASGDEGERHPHEAGLDDDGDASRG